MTTADDRLRERLASYGDALARAAADGVPTRRRHLVAVDGPGGGGRARRRQWRGPVARVAAAAAVLAVLAGTTWAATRPTDTATTTTAEGGWSDDDWVRPEDRPFAFAALEGTWPLPPNGSLRYVLDRRDDAQQTFAGFRQMLAYNASCLWFRYALEQPELTASERADIEAMPTWPGHVEVNPDSANDEILQELVDAALAGDADRLRQHLTTNCSGSAAGLGLPEIGGYWLVPLGEGRRSDEEATSTASASAIDPLQIRGWEAIAGRLGDDVRIESALALTDGTINVALTVGTVDLSLTIGRVRAPVTLPIDEAAFGRGFTLRDDGIEVYAGPVGDDATLAQVVGPDGVSVALGSERSPAAVERMLGDLADLAVAVHVAAWPS